MNLKEAFRYQKYIDLIFSDARVEMQRIDNNTIVKKVHHRSSSDATLDDFSEYVNETKKTADIDKLVVLVQKLIQEKLSLSSAIDKAKSESILMSDSHFDLDANINANKQRHLLCQTLQSVLRKTRSTERIPERSFRINANGEQVPFVYDCEFVYEENFDRENVKKFYDELTKESDAISYKIDEVLAMTTVPFTPSFNYNDTLFDILENIN